MANEIAKKLRANGIERGRSGFSQREWPGRSHP